MKRQIKAIAVTMRMGWVVNLLAIMMVGVLYAGSDQEANGLLLHWDFDGIKGRAVADSSGKGNQGRIEGEVGLVPGVRGKGILFNGDLGSVICEDNALLNPSNITVMLWLCPKEWGKANTLIDKGWAQGWGIDPHYNLRSTVCFCANISSKRTDTYASFDIPLNQWTHLAVTHDGAQTTIYVNGEKRGKAARDGGLSSNACRLRLGGMTETICYMDDVKIYDRALGGGVIKAAFETCRSAAAGLVKDVIVERLPGARKPSENLTVNAIPLVKDGAANGAIVVSALAPAITQRAVKELQRYLERIFFVRLPIVRADEQTTRDSQELKGRNLILVGESRIARELGVTAEALKPDGFRISSKENVLAIVGQDSPGAVFENMVSGSAGTLYGVYRFLETLGLRWYFPGAHGDDFPMSKDVIITDLDVTDAPYFIFRYGLAPPGADVQWMRRIGFGGIVFPAKTCHSFESWHAKYSASHPEWFALRPDGSRAKNICVSNPEVQTQVIEDAKEFFKKNAKERYLDFTILENDGAPAPCTCPECQKRSTPEEGWGGGTSDYWTEIAIKTADAVREEFPDRRIIIGAYNQQMRPPVRIKRLPANVSVQIQKLRLHIWSDEARRTNYEEILAGWLALKPASVSFWEYYGFDCWGGGKWFGLPGMATEMIANDIRTLKQLSEKSGIPFFGEMIFTNGRPGKDTPDRLYWLAPDVYVTAKLLWNPDLAIKPLMTEFYRVHFGPAEVPMRQFYERLEAVWSSGKWGRNLSGTRMSWDDMQKNGGYFGNNPWEVLFTPEILKELAGYLAQAGKLSAEEPYKQRVGEVVRQFGTTLKRAEKAGGKISADELEKAMTVW